jgi:23S rRNA pseudouridine1911/1915/1917 synthase
VLRLVVAPGEQGMRLDSFLAAATDLSRRRARVLIADGLVVRNRKPVRVQSRTVAIGDVIELLVDHGATVQLRPSRAVDLRFLHLDSWLAVVDKPAGVLSQPVAHRRDDELALDQLLMLALAEREGHRPFLRLVHRLDRLTSGAVLFARNRQATKALADSWAAGRVERVYLALVEGDPPLEDAVLDQAIARDPGHAWRFRVDASGAPARTEVKVVERLGPGRTLMHCRLLTGRTHQVRVHLAAAGLPVLGDTLYGSSRGTGASRPLLHAWGLGLPHPRTGAWLQVVSPIPDDLRAQLPDAVLESIDAGPGIIGSEVARRGS